MDDLTENGKIDLYDLLHKYKDAFSLGNEKK